MAQQHFADFADAQPVYISFSDQTDCSGPDAGCIEQDLEVLFLRRPPRSEQTIKRSAMRLCAFQQGG